MNLAFVNIRIDNSGIHPAPKLSRHKRSRLLNKVIVRLHIPKVITRKSEQNPVNNDPAIFKTRDSISAAPLFDFLDIICKEMVQKRFGIRSSKFNWRFARVRTHLSVKKLANS